jgi:hypothetical protein
MSTYVSAALRRQVIERAGDRGWGFRTGCLCQAFVTVRGNRYAEEKR